MTVFHATNQLKNLCSCTTGIATVLLTSLHVHVCDTVLHDFSTLMIIIIEIVTACEKINVFFSSRFAGV